MSSDAIRHSVRSGGPWQRLTPGVYATFNGPLAQIHRLRAAVLYAGDDSAVTGAWACHMLGLRYGPPTNAQVDVVVPRRIHRHPQRLVRVDRTAHMPPVTWWLADDSDPAFSFSDRGGAIHTESPRPAMCAL